MQAATITCMPMASNSVESSAEAASMSQGLRIDSALQSQTTDTLFTAILQQVIAVNAPLGHGVNDIPLIVNMDDANKTDGDESVDVCSLLMQMMVMNSANQTGAGNNGGSADSDNKAMGGIVGVINENPEAITEAVPKGTGMAASVLSALAASDIADAQNGNQPKGNSAAAQLDAAVAGITEALKNETGQNGAVSDAQAAGTETSADIAGNPAAANNQDTAFSLGIKEKLQAMANNEGSKTAGQAEAFSGMDSSADADATAEKTVVAVTPADDNGDNSFGGLASRDKSKDNNLGASGNAANPVLTGTGSNDETMAEKTTAVERALSRFTDDLRSVRGGSQEIRIVLEPESLGVLIISVIRTESGISAKIKSEDKQICAIISEHLKTLISSMQSKGITVDDVNVVYSQTEQNASFTQHSFSQARDETSKGYTMPADKNPDGDASTNDIWQSYFGGETGGDTTVDYRI